MALKTIRDFSLAGKKVFIRCDFNVAMKDDGGKSVIQDDTRIRAALETIEYARKKEAKVILASHLGRPKGKKDPKYTLLPVAERLSELIEGEVLFPDDCIGEGPRKLVRDLQPGQVVLLENLRYHKGEENNDRAFAQELLGFSEVYINDAFGSMHRAHASTAALPSMSKDRGIGFLVEKEVNCLGKLFKDIERPFVAILGGNKIADKIGVIRQLIHHVDSLLIAGGMAYTFLMQKGLRIGQSVYESDKMSLAEDLQKFAEENRAKIFLPLDHVIADRFAADANTKITEHADIPEGWIGLDIGPKTIQRYTEEIAKAKTIFWNGPAGVFEMEAFRKGTLALAQALAHNKGTTIVGGGDSVAAVNLLNLQDDMTLLSTGGGATLEYLSSKTLPGLQSVEY